MYESGRDLEDFVIETQQLKYKLLQCRDKTLLPTSSELANLNVIRAIPWGLMPTRCMVNIDLKINKMGREKVLWVF